MKNKRVILSIFLLLGTNLTASYNENVEKKSITINKEIQLKINQAKSFLDKADKDISFAKNLKKTRVILTDIANNKTYKNSESPEYFQACFLLGEIYYHKYNYNTVTKMFVLTDGSSVRSKKFPHPYSQLFFSKCLSKKNKDNEIKSKAYYYIAMLYKNSLSVHNGMTKQVRKILQISYDEMKFLLPLYCDKSVELAIKVLENCNKQEIKTESKQELIAFAYKVIEDVILLSKEGGKVRKGFAITLSKNERLREKKYIEYYIKICDIRQEKQGFVWYFYLLNELATTRNGLCDNNEIMKYRIKILETKLCYGINARSEINIKIVKKTALVNLLKGIKSKEKRFNLQKKYKDLLKKDANVLVRNYDKMVSSEKEKFSEGSGELLNKVVHSISKKFQCAICKKEKAHLKKCGRCQMIYYCSRTCQKKDWKRHKKKCLEYVNKNQCSFCKKMVDELKRKRCGKCKQAKYCSVACQKADWEKHKKICSEKK